MKNKIILITGAAGSIGSALARVLAKDNKIIMVDQNETGIFDLEEELKPNGIGVVCNIRSEHLKKTFIKYRPEIVFHAAAMKHVVMCERYSEEATLTNIHGLVNVINAAEDVGVEKFIFISSDKAVNPSSKMGETKKTGEVTCFYRNNKRFKCIVVRFGNVMPSQGSIVPIFKKQIDEGKNLTVTHRSMRRYFMGIYDAVNLVIKAAEIGRGGETFILDMGKPIYIKDLAEMMIKISGKPLGIVYTKPGKGEKFSEELMTKSEKKRTKKVAGLFIIK